MFFHKHRSRIGLSLGFALACAMSSLWWVIRWQLPTEHLAFEDNLAIPLSVETDSRKNATTLEDPWHQLSQSSIKDLPKPLQILQQYQRWHSREALRNDKDPKRRYAVAYYSCPLQAGNRLHHFMNSKCLPFEKELLCCRNISFIVAIVV